MMDKVALVTGAGSGIGKATAVRLARDGYRVGVLDRDEKDVQTTVCEIGEECALPLLADVSEPGPMQHQITRLGEHFGRIDAVVANAGINGVWAPLDELKPEEWDLTLAVNLKGTFLSVKYALPYLKRHGGAVVITSSVNGTRLFSNTGATAYSCSKAGQVAFAKMVALELAKYKIRVNVICPGAINTNIEENTHKRDTEREREPVEYPAGTIPLTRGKAGTAEQVAALIAFLTSEAADHITGTEIWIDGGTSLLVG